MSRAFRSLRAALAAVAVVLPLIGTAPEARADGGAYVWFERTYNDPGTATEGYASVFVPQAKRATLDRGPFYLYLLTGMRPIVENRPLPEGAIRLGAFAIARHGKEFRFEVHFTVPDLAGGAYTVMACNEPCTISGFREPLTGVIQIVATEREERLLVQQGRLHARLGHGRRELRKARREIEELEGLTDLRSIERTTLTAEAAELRDRVERLRDRVRARPRPVIAPAPAWAIAGGLLALAGALALRRRHRPRPGSTGTAPTPGPAIADGEGVGRHGAERERVGTR
jgi:hypothetical protein